MKTNLRMRCPDCKHWNRVPVDKIFVEQPTSDPEVKAFIPMYAPLEVAKCKKCGRVLAEPKVLIRITTSAGPSQLHRAQTRL